MTAWRPAVMGRNGVVASAHPAASLAGLKVLMSGGNAVDAIVAVAAALNVAEPYMSGLGGDGLMSITLPGASKPIILDYSGSVPLKTDPSNTTEADTWLGPKAPLVPGSPGGWFAALEKYGTKEPEELFAHAIELAENGTPITYKNVEFMAENADRIRPNDLAASTFLVSGHPPRPGSVLRQPRLAKTYRTIAKEGVDAFYKGSIGAEVVRSVQEAGGYLSQDDLDNFSVYWQDPLPAKFRDFEIWGPPPPSCGIEYLQLLRLLEHEDLEGMGHNSTEYLHILIESIKLASADRIAYLMQDGFDLTSLLTDEYIASQRARIDRQTAAMGRGERYGSVNPGAIAPGTPGGRTGEHTTHFAVADSSGMAVNITQSIGSPFGSGFMAGETGLMLNNFMNWTDLDPDSPNAMTPGKAMENCMAPAQIYKDGSFYATLGTPGSWGILQTTPQMILNFLVHGMNIQEAIEAPRMRFMGHKHVIMEGRIPEQVRAELRHRGHEIETIAPLTYQVGGGHGTHRDPESGVLSGGADPRRDGYAMAW